MPKQVKDSHDRMVFSLRATDEVDQYNMLAFLQAAVEKCCYHAKNGVKIRFEDRYAYVCDPELLDLVLFAPRSRNIVCLTQVLDVFAIRINEGCREWFVAVFNVAPCLCGKCLFCPLVPFSMFGQTE